MKNEKITAQMVGRLGEIAVERELLRRGWTVGNFNATVANTAAYDLFAVKGKRRVCLRVKAASGRMVQYTVKGHGSAFNSLMSNDDGDFVVIALFKDENNPEFYIMPTQVMDDAMRKIYTLWLKSPKKGGLPRKNTSHRALDFTGEQTKSIPYRGLQKVWASYLSNWSILEKAA
jgi:hypothetical protein